MRRIDYPAPLPEDKETPVLTKMLFPAPYDVPEKKTKKAAKGTRSGLRRTDTSDLSSEDETDPSVAEDDDEEEEEDNSHLRGERRKGWPPRT